MIAIPVPRVRGLRRRVAILAVTGIVAVMGTTHAVRDVHIVVVPRPPVTATPETVPVTFEP